MTEPQRYEKDEKEEKDSQMNEKGDEKQQEKMDEKSMEEKYRRDPLGSMIWAGILIWAGVVLLGGNLGFLDTLPIPEGMGSWSLVLLVPACCSSWKYYCAWSSRSTADR